MIKTFIIGIIMGIANVIPGVSGGTIAVSFNIYDRLIAFISRFRTKIKEDWKFMLFLGAGLGVGIIGFAKIMVYLLEFHQVPTSFFFLGVILGSIPLIYKKAVKPKFHFGTVIPFIVCTGIMVALYFMSGGGQEQSEMSGPMITNMLMMVMYGVIGAACMIIPGISGSFVLMFIGGYGKVMTVVSTLNIPYLAALGLGIIIGIFGCAKIINRLMYTYGNFTYAGILGFVIGSVLAVYPGYSFARDGIIPLIGFVVGFAITYGFNRMEGKNKTETIKTE